MNGPAKPARPLSLSAPRPLQLVDGTASPAASACPSPSPTIAGLSTPPPTARDLKPHRQSSISYKPSDSAPTWDARSPTSASAKALRRSFSLGQKADGPTLKANRRSLGSAELMSPQPERAPLTLAEKHADLLHFIAQKESKCLELRTQLAAHEEELAQLKRKWEHIVSRGMDRAARAGPSTPPPRTMPMTAPGLAALSRARGHCSSQSTSSASTGTTSTRSTSVRLSQSSASSLGLSELDEADEGCESKACTLTHRRGSRDMAAPRPSGAATKAPATPVSAKRASLSALPPPNLPGIGALAMQGPVASWMGSVGRKWGELQKDERIAKSQKRASVILSDVSQSLFSALGSPTRTSDSVSVSSNPFAAALSPLSPSSATASSDFHSRSLLEDDDDAGGLGSVMVPDLRSPTSSTSPSFSSASTRIASSPAKTMDQSDDEWNW
ncbi:hypothetical protein WOLCODRAFT_139355 [Wolfiporia cocos MD-104 SS10]|uniref:Uncharacterized protein n=1 Tax=Wolfiporia cocos (strain MD-104) TaxID=742152 RepID=A0A2H3JY94_WOLCO|nr:hypothetical protein WOLCODRAFT_139355 [Wolfiporia cocos MD-104 SS10]